MMVSRRRCLLKTSADKKRQLTLAAAYDHELFLTALDPDRRPKAHLQVIPRSVIEVDVIPNVEAQSKRPPEAFQPHAGINRRPRIARGDASHRRSESGWCVLVGRAEVHEPDFKGTESPCPAHSGIELRTKHRVQRAQARGHKRRAYAV